MELRDLIAILRHYWAAIALLSLLGLGAGFAMTVTTTPQYAAQATVWVAVQMGDSITDLNQGSSFAERQVQTYAEVARSPIVLDPVVARLGLDTSARALRGQVSASVQAGTALIDITVTQPTGERAGAVANAITAEMAAAVARVGPQRADGSPSITVTTISPAVTPRDPFEPALDRNLVLGLLVGLVLGLGWAALRTTLDTKVRSDADLRRVSEAAVLGAVSYDSRAARRTPTVVAPALSVRAEEYRQLRTNLQFLDAARRPRSIVVTSSRGGEGKSVTTINLAMAMTDSGLSVCLVDADLRRPSVSRYLGLEGDAGLTTVLIGRATLDDVLQEVGEEGLHVLSSGQVPPNPSELLSSQPMAEVVAALTARYDVVLFDSAPLLPVTDAAILSKLTDGVLLVAGAAIVTRDQLGESIAMLDRIGARLLGLVLNRAQRKEGGTSTYGYHPKTVQLARSRPARAGATSDPAAAAPQEEPPAPAQDGAATPTPPVPATPADDDRAPEPVYEPVFEPVPPTRAAPVSRSDHRTHAAAERGER